jgi:hypothetical protein
MGNATHNIYNILLILKKIYIVIGIVIAKFVRGFILAWEEEMKKLIYIALMASILVSAVIVDTMADPSSLVSFDFSNRQEISLDQYHAKSIFSNSQSDIRMESTGGGGSSMIGLLMIGLALVGLASTREGNNKRVNRQEE